MKKIQEDDNENIYWDKIADEYAKEALSIQPTFYQNASVLLNRELADCSIVADIGNGGVINYKTAGFQQLDCIDLSLSKTAAEQYQDVANIAFKQGNVMHLTEVADHVYDAVILQCVLHHLAGNSFAVTNSNVKKALRECMRILKPGGKLLIVESAVVPWFEKVERMLYPVMQAFFRLVKFDAVYQYSPESLLKLVEEMDLGMILSSQIVEIGKTIWLLRKKVPTKLTPCTVEWIAIKKKEIKNEDGKQD